MEVALVGRGILDKEEAVVLAHLSLDAMLAAHPVERTFHLAVGTLHAAAARGIVFGMNLNDLAISILRATGALHDVGILQTHLLARRHAEELLRRILHEVGTLNPKLTAEGNLVGSVGFVLRIVHSLHLLGLTLGIVGDDELHGVEHC